MVGLATAWFLQNHDVDVTVIEKKQRGAGASWGNAGWLTPPLTVPLPDPTVLRFGLKAMLNPKSPLYIPFRLDLTLIRFLVTFALHSTTERWRAGIRAYVPINRRALPSFATLSAAIGEPVYDASPFLACFEKPGEEAGLLAEIQEVAAAGMEVDYQIISGDEARRIEPALSDAIQLAITVEGQQYINPPRFVAALGKAVEERGATVLESTSVAAVKATAFEARLVLQREDAAGGGGREEEAFDAVVIASGAELNRLAEPFGVRQVVHAGRGYSFSVPCEILPRGPVYFPAQRVACTPLGERLRVAGMMEFRRHGEPLDPRRIEAIVEATAPLFRGVDLSQRQDEWVGSRPVTADGLPLIGRTNASRVFVAGGHGMWGITLGPATGELLAEQIVTGTTPEELKPFDPLR